MTFYLHPKHLYLRDQLTKLLNDRLAVRILQLNVVCDCC